MMIVTEMAMTAAQPVRQDRSSELKLAFPVARDMCRKRMPGFHLAAFFLSAPRRDAACAAAAFCQMIDDAIAEPESEFEKHARATPRLSLDQLAPENAVDAHDHADDECSGDTLDERVAMLGRRVEEIYASRVELPAIEYRTQGQHVMIALSSIVREYEIEPGLFLALARERRRDATTKRYAGWPDLLRHCEQIGGVKAQILACVLGLSHSDRTRQIIQLGAGLRLVEILINLKSDLLRRKIYLPDEAMRRHGLSVRDLTLGASSASMRPLVAELVGRARQLLCDGAEVLCWLGGDGSRMTASALVIGALRSLEISDCPSGLSPVQRLFVLPTAWRLARRAPGEPMPEVF